MEGPLIFIVFLTVWGVCVFFVLPFGNAPSASLVPGQAASAPERPRVKQKLIVTTLLASVITAGIVWLSRSGWITFT